MVLIGEAGTGKTAWAVGFFGRNAPNAKAFAAARAKMLFLNCTGDHLPDVSQFEWGTHMGIVYDEATPHMVWRNKEIFQGLPEWSSISDTHTHRYQTKVCLNGVRQILTCNDWWDQYAHLSPAQQEWLDGNVIMINVFEPLYTNEPLASDADHPQDEEVPLADEDEEQSGEEDEYPFADKAD